jgi:beta-mannosidase
MKNSMRTPNSVVEVEYPIANAAEKDSVMSQRRPRRRTVWKTAIALTAFLAIPTWGRAEATASDECLQRFEISSGWKIKSFAPQEELDAKLLGQAARADEGWLDAGLMPATVHDILLRLGKIEAPWLPYGTEKCFWVGQQDWVYAIRFSVEEQGREAKLRFMGIENKVDVYLNGERLASHASKLPLVVDVSGRLRAENVLVLHCHADFRPGQGERRDRGSYLGPNPAISSVGVFDQIFLETSEGHRFEEVVADAALNEALTRGTVTVDVAGVSRLDAVTLHVRLLDPDGACVGETTVPMAVMDGEFSGRGVLRINRPSLWWPRGYGDQPLYRAEVALVAQERVQEIAYRTLGFRRTTMSEPLHFVVNGVPVFLRGGNWVTPNLMSDVWDTARVDRLFDLAENANFNAFRVWGPAEAPPNAFYEQADARGFLLWQDFTRLPMRSDSKSINACPEKARSMIKRLKHHPSILSWCGCNEAAQWAHEDYNKDFADHGPWGGLAAAEAVGDVCKELDPARYYQPSSPYFGMNPNDPREGNTHGYTNMWFVPGYDYLNFASEDTRISAPVLHSLQRFMAPEDLWPEGYSTLYLHGNRRPFPATWMPYTCAESWKKTGPVEQFYDATDAGGLVHRLGMAESFYYQDTVQRQRRGRPAAEQSDRRCCGGYIVWKYNDSWPQVYSAKVDYFLEPKHVYYALRRAYAPLLLSFDFDTYLYLWAINDTREPVTGTVKVQLYHLDQNEFRKEIVHEITVPPGQSKVVVRLDQASIRAFRKEHILFATLTDNSGQALARTNAFADIERRLTFPEAKLNVQVQQGMLVLTTDKFARCVTLTGDAQGDKFGWFFEDNYFDLLPGETKVVRILGQHAEGRITAKPWYSPHATNVEWKRS